MPHPYPHTCEGALQRVLDARRGAIPTPARDGAHLAEQAAYLAALQIRIQEFADVRRRRALSEAADAA